MEKFKTYVEQLNNAKTVKEYPVNKKFDYTVTFLMPQINTAEGIYRVLLPSWHLNRSSSIRALVVGMSLRNPDISINEKDYEIKRELIKITDHFVFPFVSYSLQPIIDKIKQVKKDAKISYFIDFNYYNLPESYPNNEQYGKADFIKNIEYNIAAVDQVIVGNKELYNFLHMELSAKEHIKGSGTDICYQKPFFDKSIWPEPKERDITKVKKRFGIVLNDTQYADLAFIKGILKEFRNKHKVDLSVFGWNGEKDGKNYLKNMNVDFVPEVPFFQYPDKLNSTGTDCFIIPAKVNKFNSTSKNVFKLFEYSALNIPVIAPKLKVYENYITHNGNGVLCDKKEDWLFELNTFMESPDKFYDFANRANAMLLDEQISENDNLQILVNIFYI